MSEGDQAIVNLIERKRNFNNENKSTVAVGCNKSSIKFCIAQRSQLGRKLKLLFFWKSSTHSQTNLNTTIKINFEMVLTIKIMFLNENYPYNFKWVLHSKTAHFAVEDNYRYYNLFYLNIVTFGCLIEIFHCETFQGEHLRMIGNK
jgi:hypothetical protein